MLDSSQTWSLDLRTTRSSELRCKSEKNKNIYTCAKYQGNTDGAELWNSMESIRRIGIFRSFSGGNVELWKMRNFWQEKPEGWVRFRDNLLEKSFQAEKIIYAKIWGTAPWRTERSSAGIKFRESHRNGLDPRNKIMQFLKIQKEI